MRGLLSRSINEFTLDQARASCEEAVQRFNGELDNSARQGSDLAIVVWMRVDVQGEKQPGMEVITKIISERADAREIGVDVTRGLKSFPEGNTVGDGHLGLLPWVGDELHGDILGRPDLRVDI